MKNQAPRSGLRRYQKPSFTRYGSTRQLTTGGTMGVTEVGFGSDPNIVSLTRNRT